MLADTAKSDCIHCTQFYTTSNDADSYSSYLCKQPYKKLSRLMVNLLIRLMITLLLSSFCYNPVGAIPQHCNHTALPLLDYHYPQNTMY